MTQNPVTCASHACAGGAIDTHVEKGELAAQPPDRVHGGNYLLISPNEKLSDVQLDIRMGHICFLLLAQP